MNYKFYALKNNLKLWKTREAIKIYNPKKNKKGNLKLVKIHSVPLIFFQGKSNRLKKLLGRKERILLN